MAEEREGQSKHIEREFEVGKDEAWFANIKRTYDEFLHESLTSMRQTRVHFDKLISDAQQHDNQRQGIANQALQNAVETANMIGKQAVRHSDLAIDRQWNVDEVATLTAKSGVVADALVSAMTVLQAQALKQNEDQ